MLIKLGKSLSINLHLDAKQDNALPCEITNHYFANMKEFDSIDFPYLCISSLNKIPSKYTDAYVV